MGNTGLPKVGRVEGIFVPSACHIKLVGKKKKLKELRNKNLSARYLPSCLSQFTYLPLCGSHPSPLHSRKLLD